MLLRPEALDIFSNFRHTAYPSMNGGLFGAGRNASNLVKSRAGISSFTDVKYMFNNVNNSSSDKKTPTFSSCIEEKFGDFPDNCLTNFHHDLLSEVLRCYTLSE